jgi:hypothetical protein
VEEAPERLESPAHPERAIDVAIAEFNALRDEIVSHVAAQAALIGLALTAAGVIVGFTVKDGANQKLLLAIPPLTLLAVLLHTAETFRSALISKYIATELWEDLEGRVGKLRSWEAGVANRRQQPLHRMLPEIFVLDFPAMTILILAGGYALVQVGSGGALWWIDCGALALTVLIPIGVSLQMRRESRGTIQRRHEQERRWSEAHDSGAVSPGGAAG